ncbi:MAG: alpha/beta fold hydrolase [Methanophagales archaeon]|nr:alpha/beta fold hydrolase [Methanophagales archaeon]
MKIVLIIATLLIISAVSFNAFVSYNIHHPQRKPVLWTPLDYGMIYSDISFTSDGIKLKGWFIPNNNSNATIIMAHGYGGNRANCLEYARFFHRAGYNVLLFDFRAHGESGGNWTSNGYYESDDIIAAVDYIKTPKKLGPNRIGMLGISMGGKTAIIASAKTSDVKAIVADSSPAGFIDSMDIKKRVKMRLKWAGIPDISFLVNEELVTFFSEFQTGINDEKGKAINYVESINTPILIIHGDKDEIAPLKDAYLLYEKARETKSIWVAENAGHHEACRTHRAEYEEKVVKFFDEYLN